MGSDTKVVSMFNLEPGAVIADRFVVQEKLGTGGMGMVFKVVDRELDDTVALKTLHPHLAADETIFRRFRNEVLVARSLSHPNIVRLHDMGRAVEGFSYISMEFVDGVSLRDVITPENPDSNETQIAGCGLEFSRAVNILLQVMSGVAYAHAKDVIHRDLKPANVLISQRGEVKLADFGTARILGMDNSLTRTGQSLGTPDYMSPEQIRGEQLDASCDIYALGIIAYELVTGGKPFNADSAVAVAFKHLNDPIPHFADPARGIPQWYEDAVIKATAKKKEDRFSSVQEFIQEITKHLPEIYNAKVEALDVTSTLMMSQGGGVGGFELGDLRPKDPSGGWNLGAGSSSAARQKPEEKKAFPWVGMILLLVLLLAGAGGGAWWWMTQRGTSLESAGDQKRVPEQQGDQRAELEKELLASAGLEKVEKTGTVTAPQNVSNEVVPPEAERNSNSPETQSEGPTSSAKNIGGAVETPPGTTAVVPTTTIVTTTAPTTTVTTTIPTTTVPPTTTLPPKLGTIANSALTATLFLKSGKEGVSVDTVKSAQLNSLYWEANISGVSKLTDEAAQRLFSSELGLNLFNLSESELVSRIDVHGSIEADVSRGLSRGSLAMLARQKLSPGTYRLDLIRNGEVIAAHEFQLVGSAATSLTAPAVTTPMTPGAAVEAPAVPESVAATQNLPPAEGSTPSGENSPEVAQGGAGLPPARHLSAHDIFSPQPLSPPPVPIPPDSNSTAPNPTRLDATASLDESQEPIAPEIPVVAKEYRGSFYAGIDRSATAESAPITLELEFQGEEIRGHGEIGGLGQMKIAGKAFARGIEINLIGDLAKLRLSGSERDGVMRGTYFIPDQKKRGAWEAKLVQ